MCKKSANAFLFSKRIITPGLMIYNKSIYECFSIVGQFKQVNTLWKLRNIQFSFVCISHFFANQQSSVRIIH